MSPSHTQQRLVGGGCRPEPSYFKVRVMTGVATPCVEATLLDYADKTTAAQLERICRGYREVKDDTADREPPERTVSRRPTRDGRVRITAAPRDVPDWDGRSPDYDACVAALQSA